jgi:hypothetical protein
VGRDIGGADPERMAPPRVAEYIQDLFEKSSNVKVMKYCFLLEIIRSLLDQYNQR